MTNGRTRAARALAIFCISGLGAAALTSGPSAADPSIGDVQERVDRLYHEAQEASERYNQARIELTEARQRLRSVQEGLSRQRGMVEAGACHSLTAGTAQAPRRVHRPWGAVVEPGNHSPGVNRRDGPVFDGRAHA